MCPLCWSNNNNIYVCQHVEEGYDSWRQKHDDFVHNS